MNYHEIFSRIGNNTHIMIGGATNSGKSVTEGGVIFNLVRDYTPDEVELWLIDPKKMELVKYEWLPHVKHYADNDRDAMLLLDLLLHEMDKRNEEVQNAIRNGETMSSKYTGRAIYCFIDELADIVARQKKEALIRIQLLLQMARSANIHLVVCTQNAKRKFFPTEVQCNITCVVGLKTRTAIESRVLVESSACAELPPHGKCVLIDPDGVRVEDMPMYSDDDWKELRRDYSLRRVI